MSVIEVKDLYKSFKIYSDKGVTLKERLLSKKRRTHIDRDVLKGISFTVEKGETVGLIGHNGCGKSTLLKLLTRILYPDKGSVTVEGRVSSLLELGAGFHPDLSGRENIYANAAIFGLKKKEIDMRLQSIIDFSELWEFIDNPVRTYSSGMYTRLAFSVAISVNADVLLVDEILAVGDTNFQQKCLKKMRQLRDSGVTIVIVTHDINTVKTFCTRAIWINDGVICADGDSLQASDKYLAYMSREQQKRIEDEAKRKADREKEVVEAEEAIATGGEEIIAVEEVSDTQEPLQQEVDRVPSEETSDDDNHFGSGTVKIVKAAFTDKNGSESKDLIQGEPYSIDIFYKILKPESRLNFGIAFFTLSNALIYGTNMFLDNIYYNEFPQSGCLRFVMDSLPLLTGEYILSVAVVNEDATPLDYYRNYMVFNVLSESKATGTSVVEHHWDLLAGETEETVTEIAEAIITEE